VPFALRDRIGHLLYRAKPHLTDDAAFRDRDPRAPRLRSERAAHPLGAAGDEGVASFGRRRACRPEFPSQLGKVERVGG